MKRTALPALLALTLAACTTSPTPAPPPVTAAAIEAAPPPSQIAAPPESAAPMATAPAAGKTGAAPQRAVLEAVGQKALSALEKHDAKAFARLVHPKHGLDLGVLGTINHHVASTDVEAAFRDTKELPWDGRSNAGDEPWQMSYAKLLSSVGEKHYSRATAIGYNEVVQEDGLCGGPCVDDEIGAAFPGLPFIQYAYPTESPRNSGMWYFLVIAFQQDGDDWKVAGLLEDEWSP
ncbi:MAG: hypothetical protein U0359_15085 [Byssovorax sp.]